jgi:hypothetical protein
VDARSCLRTVDEVTDEAVLDARSRLNPTAGVMLSALWAAPSGRLVMIVHHLAVDGVSWRIMIEDLNLAWAQHRTGQSVMLPAPRTSFRQWASLLADVAQRADVVDQAYLGVEVIRANHEVETSAAAADPYRHVARGTGSGSASPGPT